MVNSVAVWCKIETEHFHEKSLVREDGWRSSWAYSEQNAVWPVSLQKGHAFTTPHRSSALLKRVSSNITLPIVLAL